MRQRKITFYYTKRLRCRNFAMCRSMLRRSGIEKGKPLLQQYHTACSWQLQLRRQCVQRWYYFGTTPRVRPARRGLTPHCMAPPPAPWRQLAVALLSTHTGCARHPPLRAVPPPQQKSTIRSMAIPLACNNQLLPFTSSTRLLGLVV